MQKLLKIIQASPNSLTKLDDDTIKKLNEELPKALNKTLNSYNIEDINLFIEIYITIFSRIIEHNQNDLNFIKNMYSETSIIRDYKYISTFIEKISSKFDSIKKPYIESIIDTIKEIPTKNNTNTWNIASRKLCSKIHDSLFPTILTVNKESSIISIEKILKECQNIILSPIPNNLTTEEKNNLIDIIYKHSIIFSMSDEPIYQVIIQRLTELNALDKIKELNKIKKAQLKNEQFIKNEFQEKRRN